MPLLETSCCRSRMLRLRPAALSLARLKAAGKSAPGRVSVEPEDLLERRRARRPALDPRAGRPSRPATRRDLLRRHEAPRPRVEVVGLEVAEHLRAVAEDRVVADPAPRSASSISGQTSRCASMYSSIWSGRTSRTNALRWVIAPPCVEPLVRRSRRRDAVAALSRRGPAPPRSRRRGRRRPGSAVDAESARRRDRSGRTSVSNASSSDPVRAEHVALAPGPPRAARSSTSSALA